MKYLAKTGWGLYTLRYQFAYIVLLSLLAWLAWLAFDTPGALSRDEYSSVVISDSFSLTEITPSVIANAPYHILQKISFLLFGISPFSIKLPSLILGALSLVMSYYLLHVWFNRRVALLAVALVATGSPLLYFMQSGTPDVLYMFIPALVLFAATMLTHTSKFHLVWKLLLAAGILTSLYVPAAIYMLVAMLIATLFHPHVRHVAFHLSRWKLVAAGAILLIGIIPIVLAVMQQPVLLPTLFGLEATRGSILDNLAALAQTYVRFDTPSIRPVLQPLYTLPIFCIAIIGLGKLLTTKYIARSYIIFSWLVLLVAVSVVHVQSGALLFTPLLLLVGFGLRTLVQYWYVLFPFNPYARTTGLLAIILVVGSIVTMGINQYNTVYRYSPALSQYFSNDLHLLKAWQRNNAAHTVLLIPRAENTAMYRVLAEHTENWTVRSATQELPDTQYIIRTTPINPVGYGLDTILVDGKRDDSARFFVYKKTSTSVTIE